MQDTENTYWSHDAFLGVWKTPTDGSDHFLAGDFRTFNKVQRLMMREGFSFHQDPEIKKCYPSISKNYFAGRRGGVMFASEIYRTGFRFEFYEDVIRDNPCGGRYHFDKMAKAPYLWRLAVISIRRKIEGLLTSLGLRDRTDPVPKDAMDEVRLHRARLMEFQGPTFYSEERPRYNVEDRDGRLVKDGDTVYFYERNGRLMRGQGFHNINNMWWIIVDRYDVRNICVHDLFTYVPSKHVRKWSPNPLVAISHALERAVKAKNFRKAAVIQDALGRMAQSFDFKKGDKVQVDNPRYKGDGIVDHVNPPFWVWVTLSNGNTWRYEWATVTPAPKEVPVGAV